MFPSGELFFHAAESTVNSLGEGDFAKDILLLALAEPSSPENKTFIAKVLSAANLDLSTDTLFAEIPLGQPVNCYAGLGEPPKYIFVFGLPPAQVGFFAAVQPYQSLILHGSTWVFADALSILEPDRDKKGKLWTVLKKVFL